MFLSSEYLFLSFYIERNVSLQLIPGALTRLESEQGALGKGMQKEVRQFGLHPTYRYI